MRVQFDVECVSSLTWNGCPDCVEYASIVGFSGSFDDLAETMPQIVREAARFSAERAEALGLKLNPDDAEPCDFVLVGYSTSAGRMVGHAFQKKLGQSDIVETRDFPQVIGPIWNDYDLSKLGIRADEAGMKKLALDQCRRVREREPAGLPIGGRLFIAEIKKDRITVEQACHFPKRKAAQVAG